MILISERVINFHSRPYLQVPVQGKNTLSIPSRYIHTGFQYKLPADFEFCMEQQDQHSSVLPGTIIHSNLDEFAKLRTRKIARSTFKIPARARPFRGARGALRRFAGFRSSLLFVVEIAGELRSVCSRLGSSH